MWQWLLAVTFLILAIAAEDIDRKKRRK